MTTAASDADRHLQTVITHWDDLHHALASTGTGTWPPAGRMSDYLAALDQVDAEEAEAARWRAAAQRAAERNPDQIGETRAPVRLAIVDTMRTVEAALVHLADQLAAVIQRPTLTVPTGCGWTDDVHRQAALLAARDSADPARWRYSGQRTAVRAAEWLLQRVRGEAGPCRRLDDGQLRLLGQVAAEAAGRIERALELTREARPLAEPCPDCAGQLTLEGGDGQTPAVRCGGCGRTWREPESLSYIHC